MSYTEIIKLYKRFKYEIGYQESSFIYFIVDILCDKNGINLTVNSFLTCRDFRLHNNKRLTGQKVLDNGYFEYL